MQTFTRRHLVALVVLTLFCSLALAAMGDTAEAAGESAQVDDAPTRGTFVDDQDLDAAALAWMADAMQMSIDPTDALKGIKPDWSCGRAPYNCKSTEFCPYDGGFSLCRVTACGEGKCSWCPVNPPFRIVKSWCSYACMKESTIVGGAWAFRLAGDLWWGPTCL